MTLVKTYKNGPSHDREGICLLGLGQFFLISLIYLEDLLKVQIYEFWNLHSLGGRDILYIEEYKVSI